MVEHDCTDNNNKRCRMCGEEAQVVRFGKDYCEKCIDEGDTKLLHAIDSGGYPACRTIELSVPILHIQASTAINIELT